MRKNAQIKKSHDPAALGTSGYPRREEDFYPTPAWCTSALTSAGPRLRGVVWEPACGRGDMVAPLQFAGYQVVASDLVDYGRGYTAGVDFLQVGALPNGVRSIVTNPPFDLSDEFVRKALDLTRPVGGQVAFLLRVEWDCAAKRQELFSAPPFSAKVILTRRPRWFEGTTVAPRFSYAWYVWDHFSAGPATLAYAQ